MAPVHMAWADILSVICTIPNAFRRRETHPFFLVPVLAFLLAMFVWLLPWQHEMFVWLVVCRHQKMVATWFRLRLCLQVAFFCVLAHRWLFAHLCVFKKRLTSGERMCLNGCLLFQDGCFSANCLSNMLFQFSYLSLENSSTFLWRVCVTTGNLAVPGGRHNTGGIICLVPASRSWCTGRILLLGRSTGLVQDIRSRCFQPILRDVQQIP